MNLMEDGKREAKMVFVAYPEIPELRIPVLYITKNRSRLLMEIPSGTKLGSLDASSPTTLLDS